MGKFKTLLGKDLCDHDDTPQLTKLWLAAFNYERATRDREFVEKWGSAEDFHHDLLIILEQSTHFMHSPEASLADWSMRS